jgi:hypothetical protein
MFGKPSLELSTANHRKYGVPDGQYLNLAAKLRNFLIHFERQLSVLGLTISLRAHLKC